jgi:hypothetical protein
MGATLDPHITVRVKVDPGGWPVLPRIVARIRGTRPFHDRLTFGVDDQRRSTIGVEAEGDGRGMGE